MSSYSPSQDRIVRRRWKRGSALLVGLLALAVVGLLVRGHLARAPVPATIIAPSAIELAPEEVATIQPQVLTARIRVTGSLRPLDQSQVKAEVAAKLAEVLVREGEAVTRGQVLARFAVEDIRSRLDEKQSNLAAARANLTYSQRMRANAEQLRQSGYGAQTTLDQTESKYRADQAAVQASQAQLDMARKALQDATVRAPMDGVISERVANPGETFPVDAKLFTIVDPARMEVEATVPARDAAQLHVGQPVDLRVDGFANRAFAGSVTRISPTTQAGSRSIPVYITIANVDGALKGGMFALGTVVAAERKDAIALPPAALRKDAQGDFVLRLDNDRLVRQAVVQAESWNDGELIRVEGLTPGQIVVIAPLAGLQPGTAAHLPRR